MVGTIRIKAIGKIDLLILLPLTLTLSAFTPNYSVKYLLLWSTAAIHFDLKYTSAR